MAMAAYVGLLVRLRKVADERIQKLRYLKHHDDESADAAELPAGGSAWAARFAHPSHQAAAAR
jgi:hypothetical protein